MKTNFLTIASLLTLSFREIKNRFRYFFLLALIGPVCGWLLQGFANGFDPYQAAAQPASIFTNFFFNVLALLISVWAVIALVLFVCKRAGSLRDIFLFALQQFPRVLGGLLMYVLGLTLYIFLFVLLITLTLWIFHIDGSATAAIVAMEIIVMVLGLVAVTVYLILLPYVLILTDIPFWQTFATSYKLIKNSFWKTFILLFVLGLIAGGMYMLFLFVFGIVGFVSAWVLPFTRYVFSFLMVIPSALVLLANQIPLIALYIDRSALLSDDTNQQTAN